jgi:hypothetical protein
LNRPVATAVLALQSFQVLFLLLHDWIPLGSLNDLQGVRAVDSLAKRVVGTLVSALPFALGLVFSCAYAARERYPKWVVIWLWASYGLLFAGEIRAWWWPYLWRADPELAARYRVRFANAHTFLPERNGIAPDTLHLILHAATMSTLLLLLWL